MSIPTGFVNYYRWEYIVFMKKIDNRKKALTPDLLDECHKLKNIFEQKKKLLKISQSSIADAMGVNQSSVSHYLNGVNALNPQAASIFAKILEIDVSDFSPRLSQEIEKIAQILTFNDDKLISTNQADGERIEYSSQSRETFSYPLVASKDILNFLSERLSPNYMVGSSAMFLKKVKNGFAYEMKNDSMACSDLLSFPEGCKVLIDIDQTTLENGKFYLIILPNGKEVLKQYINDGGINYLKSLNSNYRSLDININDCQIIGKAVDRNLGEID